MCAVAEQRSGDVETKLSETISTTLQAVLQDGDNLDAMAQQIGCALYSNHCRRVLSETGTCW
jgi:hypothetical protein